MKKQEKNISFLSFLAILIVFLFPVSDLKASSIRVTPVRLQLLENQKITSFEITNEADEPLTAQLHVVKWTQHEGKDVHEKTKDILITPPIVKIAPHETQLVRVGLLIPRDPKKGGTYRVVINEVQEPSDVPFQGIKTILEIRVPLLVSPLIPSLPSAVVSAHHSDKKEIKVKLLNKGLSHLVLHTIILKKEGEEKPLVEKTIYDYVIPFQSKEWSLDVPESFKGNTIHILVKTDQGDISSVVQLP